MRSVSAQYPPPFEAQFAFEQQANRFGINAVLLGENARGERCHRVVVAHWNDRLAYDRTGVHAFVHEVDGTTSKFHAVFERLPLGIFAGKDGSNAG